MVVQTVLLLTSLALAALLGFAAHRASICTVKAVEEVLTTRRGFMLLSFAKTVLWIIAATAPLVWALPDARGHLAGWQLSWTGLAGGAIFGVGAVFNKGCAFSTLTRLGDGQLAMLASLAGFALGVVGFSLADAPAPVPAKLGVDADVAQAGLWARLGLAVLLVWTLWETWRLWHTRPTGQGLRSAALAERYRLSTAALLLGVSNAVLYALHGPWP